MKNNRKNRKKLKLSAKRLMKAHFSEMHRNNLYEAYGDSVTVVTKCEMHSVGIDEFGISPAIVIIEALRTKRP